MTILVISGSTIAISRFFDFMFTYSVGGEKRKSINSEEKFEDMLNTYIKEGPQALSNFVKESDLPYIWKIVATKLEIKVPVGDIKNILSLLK